jgi:hypothetical protein
MSQSEGESRLSPKQERAAALVASERLTDEQVATEIGVDRRTIIRWRQTPAFAARVQAHVTELCEAVRKRGIAIRERRIAALQDRHERLLRVIAERAEAPEMQDVPGGTTGLLTHDVKSVGAGALAERVDLYELDAALLRELREHERQAAEELGQWTQKHEHAGPGGAPLAVKIIRGVSMDEI